MISWRGVQLLTTVERDRFWSDTIQFLTQHLKPIEFALVPGQLRQQIQQEQLERYHLNRNQFLGYQSTYSGLILDDFNWVVVHKGMLEHIHPEVLRHLDSKLEAVFANEVFVIFARQRPDLPALKRRHPHLKPYYQTVREFLKTCPPSTTDGTKPSLSSEMAAVGSQDVFPQGDRSRELQQQTELIQLLRKVDVLLCSYPKSGRTWLRIMLAAYLNQIYAPGTPITLDAVAYIVPELWFLRTTYQDEQTAHYRALAEKSGIPLIVATHLVSQVHILRTGKSMIFLFRSIYDVLVSQYFERVHRQGDKDAETIWEFIQREKTLEACVNYLNRWAIALEYHPCHLTLTYEDLKRDTVGSVSQVLQFMSIPVERERVQQAVDSAAFQRVQALEKQSIGLGNQENLEDAARLRARRGIVGGYRDYLDETAVQTIHNYCLDTMNDACKRLFARHQINI
jgi:alcohol sulfotransferase